LRMNRKQRGFTWVEVSIVLVILSIVATIMFNRSITVFDSKAVTDSKQVTEAFEKGVNLAHLKWSDEGGQGAIVEVYEHDVEVTSNGWAKQLNENLAGCVSVWNAVLPDAPEISIYDPGVPVDGWSVGGGPNVCYFINQSGSAFDEEKTPYFRYSNTIGQVVAFNM